MTKFLEQVGFVKEKPAINKLFDERFVKAYAEKTKKQVKSANLCAYFPKAKTGKIIPERFVGGLIPPATPRPVYCRPAIAKFVRSQNLYSPLVNISNELKQATTSVFQPI